MDHPALNADPEMFLGISCLHGAYADIASRMVWDEMTGIVVPDARFTFTLADGQVIELNGPDELGAFGRQATDSFDFYSYEPLNTALVTRGPTHATGRFYAHEVALVAGSWLEFYGTYDDEYVLADGRWKFARRDFRVQATRVGT